jgi:hypothetical protein
VDASFGLVRRSVSLPVPISEPPLSDGKWTSNFGKAEDIEHDTPDVVAGGIYGEVVEIMRRPSGTKW